MTLFALPDVGALLDVAVSSGRAVAGPPPRPDRLVRAGLGLLRWGVGLPAAVAASAARHPDRVAIVDDDGSVTFSELDERTTLLAAAWRATGIRADGERVPRVGVLCRNSRLFVEATVAAMKAGADVVFCNTEHAAEQLAGVVADEGIDVLVHDADLAEVAQASAAKRLVDAMELDRLIARRPRGTVPRPARRSRVVILTSGTTGRPKGADRSASVHPLVVTGYLSRVPLRQGAPLYVVPPLFHALGLAHLAYALALACPLVLTARFDPELVLRTIAEQAVEVVVAVPVMLQRMLGLAPELRRRYDTATLRVVVVSGAALPAAVSTAFMDEFGECVYNLYGSTEVSVATIATPAELRRAPTTVGRALPATTVRVVDADGRDVAPGEVGRVFVGSAMRFSGYTGGQSKEELDGLLATDDLGHLDEDQLLFIDGRADDMIISGGENVYPGEVEELLLAQDRIADCSVVGVDDEAFGQRLRAYVVPVEGGERVTEEWVRDLVRSRLARYKVPREVLVVEELPRTATGKVLKRELLSASDDPGGPRSTRRPA